MRLLVLLLTGLVVAGRLKLSLWQLENHSGFPQYVLPEIIRSIIYPTETDF